MFPKIKPIFRIELWICAFKEGFFVASLMLETEDLFKSFDLNAKKFSCVYLWAQPEYWAIRREVHIRVEHDASIQMTTRTRRQSHALYSLYIDRGEEKANFITDK